MASCALHPVHHLVESALREEGKMHDIRHLLDDQTTG